MKRNSVPGVVLLIALALVGVPVAYGSQSTGFSGYETSAGTACGRQRTCGTSFAGWTTRSPTWVLPSQSTGGFWTASIDYRGTPGISGTGQENAVTLTGGNWSWIEPTGVRHQGRVTGGQATWPPDLASDRGCGAGIAMISATIREGPTRGTIIGCLDDTHLSTVFPPHIWGQLALGL